VTDDPGTVETRDDDGSACPMCESRDGEGHQEYCPFYLPICACGRATNHAGRPCGRCERLRVEHPGTHAEQVYARR